MFANPAAPLYPALEPDGPVRFGRWKSRVAGRDEITGEIPVMALAEEIETPGEGQVRALVTIAGNPLRTAPNSQRLERAVASLEFMVSLDWYVNETTRHADLILPPTGPLERGHYDLALNHFAVRNHARWSPPVLDAEPGTRDAWTTATELARRIMGLASVEPAQFDALVLRQFAQLALGTSRVEGRALDRRGHRGRRQGARPGAHPRRAAPPRPLRRRLRQAAGGPDALPREAARARARSGPARTHAARAPAHGEREDRARAGADRRRPAAPRGVAHRGRRRAPPHQPPRRPLDELVAPQPSRRSRRARTAARCRSIPTTRHGAGLADGASARLRSRVGEIQVPVEITTDVMPGVVSLPHGFGHDGDGLAMSVASRKPGANVNAVTDDLPVDVPSGSSMLFGGAVEVARA